MNWFFLLIAGLLEVVWAVGLKRSVGFTSLAPSLITVVALVASLYLLSVALRALPLGTAYTVWVGIGAVGAMIAGTVLFSESLSAMKVVSAALIVTGIVGMKLATSA